MNCRNNSSRWSGVSSLPVASKPRWINARAAVSPRQSERCKQPGGAMIHHREVLPAGLLAQRACQPTFADPCGSRQQQPASLADPVAAGELEKEPAIQTTGSPEVDVLDMSIMAQVSRPGPALKPLLAAQGRLALEQERKPVAMLQSTRLWLGLQILEAFGHAVKTKIGQQGEGGMGQHGDLLSGSSRGRAGWRAPGW